MDHDHPKFKKWLNKLQFESWQLELVISGFAIYGLVSLNDVLPTKMMEAQAAEDKAYFYLWSVAFFCNMVLIFNLVVHVLLRGLWIGAIGLRYVSGDIDFDQLHYSEKFTHYLKKNVGTFDRYISRLENFCSIIFSVTFLMVFYIIGFFSIILFLALLGLGFPLLEDYLPKTVVKAIALTTVVITLIGVFLVFLDFIALGLLKKRKWTTKLYFPFYWVFSKLTLSFLYRPIAYNLLDNKFGRKVSLILIPFYLAIFYATSITKVSSNYLNNLNRSSVYYTNKNHYENEILEDTEFVELASIPSKAISTPYIKVFMVYKEAMEDMVYKKNKTLKPEEDKRGYSSQIVMGFKMGANEAANGEISYDDKLDEYLTTLNSLYSTIIDTTAHVSDFTVSKNAKNQLGFETYLNIRDLPEGKHLLTIIGPKKKNKDKKKNESKEDKKDDGFEMEMDTLITIPFWYFPEHVPIIPKINEDSPTPPQID